MVNVGADVFFPNKHSLTRISEFIKTHNLRQTCQTCCFFWRCVSGLWNHIFGRIKDGQHESPDQHLFKWNYIIPLAVSTFSQRTINYGSQFICFLNKSVNSNMLLSFLMNRFTSINFELMTINWWPWPSYFLDLWPWIYGGRQGAPSHGHTLGAGTPSLPRKGWAPYWGVDGKQHIVFDQFLGMSPERQTGGVDTLIHG